MGRIGLTGASSIYRQDSRMNRFLTSLILVLALGLVVVSTASAHTPIGANDNESLTGATVIPDAAKSWAIYTALHQRGEAQYYKFEAKRGLKVPIQLFVSPSQKEIGFTPGLVLMGPGIPNQGTVPSYVQVPAGVGSMVVTGTPPAPATYEPFAPSVYLQVGQATFDAPADGTYYVAVFDSARGGNYGVAIGEAETFTPYEWVSTPLSFAHIYAWEGRSLFLVYVPAFVTVLLGLVLLMRRHRRGRRMDLPGWLAASGGLVFLASGVTVAFQAVLDLMRATPDILGIATLIITAFALLLGVLTLLLAMHRSGRWTIGSRLYLAVLGAFALVVWAGWIAGPVLVVVASVIPSRMSGSGLAAPTAP